jgi:YHS domain-containing protein
MAIDPVCKMEVDEKSAAATSEYKGTTYYFCEKFLGDEGHEHHGHH